MHLLRACAAESDAMFSVVWRQNRASRVTAEQTVLGSCVDLDFDVAYMCLCLCLLLVGARNGRMTKVLHLAGSYDKTVRLWSSTGEAIATLEGHTEKVFAVAWSADGTLASGWCYYLCAL